MELADSAEERALITACQTRISLVMMLAMICVGMLAWGLMLFHSELLWRVNKDDNSSQLFGSLALPAGMFIGLALRPIIKRQMPSQADREYFATHGRLAYSRWLIPLIIALCLTVAFNMLVTYIWVLWQYPSTDWFRGHH